MRISVLLTAIVSLATPSTPFAQTMASTTPGSQPATSTPAPAPAQERRHPGNWMFEVYGAGFGDLLRSSIGGRATSLDSFPVGTPFTTIHGHPGRTVSSWAFGDGAAHFAEVRQSFAEQGLVLPAIVPLDPAMRARGTVRTPRNAFGVRFARNLTSWLAAEVAVERGSRQSRLSDDVTAGIEATRASYRAAFEGLLAAIPHTDGAVTVTAATPDGASDGQTIASGSVVLSLVRTSRVGVHTVFGGGVIINDSSNFEARLQGNYRFRLLSRFPINETDAVTIRYSEQSQTPMGLVGLGMTLRLAGRSGLRVDARVLGSRNTSTTTIAAAASRAATNLTVALPSNTTPSLQFSTRADAPTTLSGEPIDGLVTYTGRGFDLRPQVTIGYYVRF